MYLLFPNSWVLSALTNQLWIKKNGCIDSTHNWKMQKIKIHFTAVSWLNQLDLGLQNWFLVR